MDNRLQEKRIFTLVGYKLEFDAKSRGLSVHIGHPQKSDFSQNQKDIHIKRAGGY